MFHDRDRKHSPWKEVLVYCKTLTIQDGIVFVYSVPSLRSVVVLVVRSSVGPYDTHGVKWVSPTNPMLGQLTLSSPSSPMELVTPVYQSQKSHYRLHNVTSETVSPWENHSSAPMGRLEGSDNMALQKTGVISACAMFHQET